MNLTPRKPGAPSVKAKDYLPTFASPKAEKEPWDPKVRERLLLRMAKGLAKSGVGEIRKISPERMAEIRAGISAF